MEAWPEHTFIWESRNVPGNPIPSVYWQNSMTTHTTPSYLQMNDITANSLALEGNYLPRWLLGLDQYTYKYIKHLILSATS